MLLTIITFFIILSILVLGHEFGHFIVAKKSGIKVEEFGFGLPPRIWGKKIGETIYSINLLPIGGFVRLYGEDVEDPATVKESERAFFGKPKLIRTAVVIAGVIMNFLFAVLAFTIIYAKLGIPAKTENVKVLNTVPNSPAERAGLITNDQILKVNEVEIKSTESFQKIANDEAGKRLKLVVLRDGEQVSLSLTPRKDPPQGEGPIGVIISDSESKFYPIWEMPFRGAVEGFKEAFAWTGLILASFAQMISQLIHGSVPQDVAGPVGIFQVTGLAARAGFIAVLQFFGILSVNLAIMNILPLPALDGGRLAFIIIEAITRKKVNAELERKVHSAGMAVLLFLILLITINDLKRILGVDSIISNIQNIFK